MVRKQKKERKQKYNKPHLRVIELVADEVLGASCKLTMGGGPGQPVQCTAGCYTAGS